MKKVLTIAGSDCSGGAGIQADLKTMTAYGVYGMSVVTALTAQNTVEVTAISTVDPEFVKMQLDSVFTDIVPDAVKIGMLANAEVAEAVAEKLAEYNAQNVVLDPVMVSSNGTRLLDEAAVSVIIEKLVPLSVLVTPNIPEAEVILDRKIATDMDCLKAAQKMARDFKTSVLLKGGHLEKNANDLLFSSGKLINFRGERIDSNNTHGTGCTLSAAIASNLALGLELNNSVRNAKEYVTNAIKAGADLSIGNGKGPVNHCYKIKG